MLENYSPRIRLDEFSLTGNIHVFCPQPVIVKLLDVRLIFPDFPRERLCKIVKISRFIMGMSFAKTNYCENMSK